MNLAVPPRLSVVIPCYNAAPYICATIASVLAQGQPDTDIIVVDDGSADDSVARVRAAYPAVRVIKQENQGVAAARNNGVRAARGEWIAFIDADDIWLPGKIAAQFDQLAGVPDCRMSYTAWHVWPSQHPDPTAAELMAFSALATDPANWQGASGWIYPELLLDCEVWTSTVLAHRSLFEEAGLFDAGLKIGEDYDLWLRIARVTQILRVARPYALYRVHPDSITRSTPAKNFRAIVIERALGRWGGASPDGRLADMAAVRRALAKSWSDFGGSHLRQGNFAVARDAAWRALRADPTHLAGCKIYCKAAAGALARLASFPYRNRKYP